MPLLLRALTISLLAASCSFGSSGSDPSEIAPSGPTAPIMFLGLDLPPVGSTMGGHYAGSTAVRQARYQLTDGLRARWTMESREDGEALLRGAGYRVRPIGPPTSDVRELTGVQYGLTGVVHDLVVRTSGQLEPYQVDVSVDIGWELIDLGGGLAIFGRRVQGSARGRGDMAPVIVQALDDALQRLIAEPSFRNAVATPRSDPDADRAIGFVRTVPAPGETFVIALTEKLPSPDSGPVGRMAAGLVTLHGDDKAFGTAVVITRDGLAIAPAGEVRSAYRLRARLPSGVDRPVRLVRSSSSLDIALLQLACPGECVTVDWEAPREVPVHTNVLAVGAPVREGGPVSVITGRVGGRWGVANGITLEGMGDLVGGGEPVGRTATGRVFGVVAARRGRRVVLLLDEVFRSLRIRVEAERVATPPGT